MNDWLFQTEHLILRKLRENDYHSFIKYRNDPEIMKYQSWDHKFTVNSYAIFIADL